MLFRWKIQCISVMYLFTICPTMKCYFSPAFNVLSGIKWIFLLKSTYIKLSHTCVHDCYTLYYEHFLSLLFAYIALIFCSCQQHLLQLNRVVYIHVQHFVNDSNKMTHRGTNVIWNNILQISDFNIRISVVNSHFSLYVARVISLN